MSHELCWPTLNKFNLAIFQISFCCTCRRHAMQNDVTLHFFMRKPRNVIAKDRDIDISSLIDKQIIAGRWLASPVTEVTYTEVFARQLQI